MGLGQYNSQGEYCGPHTASSVFFILLLLQPLKDLWEMVGIVCGIPYRRLGMKRPSVAPTDCKR